MQYDAASLIHEDTGCGGLSLRRLRSLLIDFMLTCVRNALRRLVPTLKVWVYQTVMKGVEMQFANLSANIKTEFTLHAAHSWVVDGQTCSAPGVVQGGGGGAHCCGYKNRSTVCPLPPHAATPAPGGCCGQCYSGDGDDRQNRTSYMGWRPPINSCDYDMSGEILRWVLGDANVKPRHTSPLKGGVSVNPAHLFQVNQSQFLQPGWNTTTALLDNWGFLYIPKQCQLQNAAAAAASANGAERSVGEGVAASNASCAASAMFSDSCRIHVHYHPCGGSVRDVSTSYMLQNGLPAYAEANNIVLLYPQSAKYNNPASDACWDWYGATDEAFDTKDGVQIKFVLEMMRQLRGKGEQKGARAASSAASSASGWQQ